MSRFDTYTGVPTTTSRFNTYGSTTPQVQALRAKEIEAKKASDYANSPIGLAVETVKGLPAALGNTVKDIGQSVARTVGSVGMTAANAVAPGSFDQEIQTNNDPITNAVFGGVPLTTLQRQNELAQKSAAPLIGAETAKAVSPFMVAGGVALDLLGMGGAAERGVKVGIESLVKTLVKEKSPKVIEEMLLKTGMEAPKAKLLAPKFATASTENDVRSIISNDTGIAKVPITEPFVPGTGYQNFARKIDSFVASNTLHPEEATILKTLFEGTDDAYLGSLSLKDSARLTSTLGRGVTTKMWSTGNVLKQTLLMQKGAAKIAGSKAYPEASSQTVKVFLHEYGHLAHHAVLDDAERAVISEVYNSLGNRGAQSLFEKGLSGTGDASRSAKYYAKNEREFLAESFSNYMLQNKVPAEQMRPLLERLVNKFAEGLMRLVHRGEVPAMERMRPIFEKMLSGDKASPLSRFMDNQPPSFRQELIDLLGKPSETKPLFTEKTNPNATPLEMVDSKVPGGLEALVRKGNTPISKIVNIVDYLRTPFNVLKKIGLEESAKILNKAAAGLEKEMPQVMDKILSWSKMVSKEGNVRIFQFLDGEKIDLSPEEAKVATEIRTFLVSLADRLGLPKDKRITDYITHLWPPGSQQEFPEDILKIIANKTAGSVWDPYLLQRQGAEGYIRDTWGALEAYSKTAIRKIHMDPALEHLKAASIDVHPMSLRYVERYTSGVNRRPGEVETLIDNTIKSALGYKLGVRPTAKLLSNMRHITSIAKLGMKVTSALQNLTQGVNSFAELGGKYTFIGYRDLMAKGAQELKDTGVLQTSFMEDRTRSAVRKFWQKADDAMFYNFTITEQINRGAAYYGAKARALAMGKTEAEAIQEGVDIAAKTQFKFGSIDTPVALNNEIVKTAAQFQSFTIKQLEFLGDKVAEKDYASLARYVAASSVVYGSIGTAFGMSMSQVVPFLRLGTPPSFDIVGRTYTNLTGGKDQYGNTPTIQARLRDERKAILTDLVPGGSQIEKTLGGLGAVSAGQSRTAPSEKNPKGLFQYKIAQTPGNYVRGALFGKSNLKEAKNYADKKAGSRFNVFGK